LISTNRLRSQRVASLMAGLSITALVLLPTAANAIESDGGQPDINSGGLFTFEGGAPLVPGVDFKTIQIPTNSLNVDGLQALSDFVSEVPDTSRLAQNQREITRVLALVSPLLADADTGTRRSVSHEQAVAVRASIVDTITAGNDLTTKLHGMVDDKNRVILTGVNPAIDADSKMHGDVTNMIQQVGGLPNNGSTKQRIALATLYSAINDIVGSEETIDPELKKISDLTRKAA